MDVLPAACAIFVLLALFFAGRMARCTRKGKIVRAFGSGLSAIASAVIATAAILIAISYYSYERLTAEQVIARIEFRRLAPGEFQARLMVDGEHDRLFPLAGDEWQIDARLVSWKPPVTILGLDPIYRLERLSGRYTDITRERTEPRTVHALTESQPLDVWRLARRFPALTPGIDAYYGSATYVPMADGARFDVSLSRDALIARPSNNAARAALGAWHDR